MYYSLAVVKYAVSSVAGILAVVKHLVL